VVHAVLCIEAVGRGESKVGVGAMDEIHLHN
jgi:hypothetical protein